MTPGEAVRQAMEVLPCELGRAEYDGARYCYTHFGFRPAGSEDPWCDRLLGVKQEGRAALMRSFGEWGNT